MTIGSGIIKPAAIITAPSAEHATHDKGPAVASTEFHVAPELVEIETELPPAKARRTSPLAAHATENPLGRDVDQLLPPLVDI